MSTPQNDFYQAAPYQAAIETSSPFLTCWQGNIAPKKRYQFFRPD
jgi:hypothetical protein